MKEEKHTHSAAFHCNAALRNGIENLCHDLELEVGFEIFSHCDAVELFRAGTGRWIFYVDR